MESNFLILYFIVMSSMTIETVIGFGGTLLALTFGSSLFPVEHLIAVILPVNLSLSGAIALRHRHEIDKTVLYKNILPLMALGLIGGILLSSIIHGPMLKRLLVSVVIFTAVTELIKMKKQNFKMIDLHPKLWIFTGGIVHGLYTTGGPFVVTAVNKMIGKKEITRNTLATLWFILNLVMISVAIYRGSLTLEVFKRSLILGTTLLISIPLGNYLLHQLDQKLFKVITLALLILSGVSLLLT